MTGSRTPAQIVGHDALTQLIFEGYEVHRAPAPSPHTAVEPVAWRWRVPPGGWLYAMYRPTQQEAPDGAEALVPLSTLTAQAAALVAADERVQALMAERTNLIATKRDQLAAADSEAATLKARVAELEAGLDDVFRLNDECSGSEPSISVLMRAIDDLRARRLTHQEKNNGR